MSHDFTRAIETAFVEHEYKARRAGRVALPPLQFEFGPYHSPQVEICQTVECARYGEVQVVGWSEGPLPWPQCHFSGPRSLILLADLAVAVERESARAVALAWGVSRASVWQWRRALNVARANEGTSARWSNNMPLVITPERNRVGLERAHALDARARAEATKAAGSSARTRWTPEQIAQMGVLSDAVIAESAGCHVRTVGRERARRGIVSVGHGGPLPNLLPLDGDRVRARRLYLQLTQAQVGARFGCIAHRISHLESGHAPRVTADTLDKLARALECAATDLQSPDVG